MPGERSLRHGLTCSRLAAIAREKDSDFTALLYRKVLVNFLILPYSNLTIY